MNIENELKLIPSEGITQEQIAQILRKKEIDVPEKGKIIHQEDTYFDDEKGTLEKSGGSFRIRRKGDKTQVTYKIPVESETEYKQRKEYEIVVPKEYEDSLDMNLAMRLLKAQYPELDFPENMGEILTVINDRNKIDITCPDGTVLEMAFDSLKGRDGNGNLYKIRSEIEFETISGNPENLTDVYETILKEFPGQTEKNTLSKYARTKKEIQGSKLTEEEVAACIILSETLKSVEFNKLQYKGQILHRYDIPTLTNLNNFKNFDYLVQTLEKIKSGQYKISIPRSVAEKEHIKELLAHKDYEVKDKITLEDMMCLLLSDVKYKVADEVLVDFLDTNYYAKEQATTNRLSHSQQVMLISGLIAKSSEVDATFEEKITSMISGLTHDIGHVPMSHTLEGILKEMDGLFSHEVNGKKTLDDICERTENHMRVVMHSFFPQLSEQAIREILEKKSTDIKSGIINHSRKGAENRENGINNQAPRVSDKICYSVSDVSDLIRYAQTVQGKDLSIVDDEWVNKAALEICKGNKDLAEELKKHLDEKYIKYLKEGNYGRAVVNSANSVQSSTQGEKTHYDVEQKMWKFIEKLIDRVKDVREGMGVEQAKKEMSVAAFDFITENLYQEYIRNNQNIDLAWENLQKNITRMGELEILAHIKRRKEDMELDALTRQETITPSQATSILNRIISVYSNNEDIAKRFRQLTPEHLLEYFKKHKAEYIPNRPDMDVVQRIIDTLHDMADVQLKIKPGPDTTMSGIWRELKIPTEDDAEQQGTSKDIKDDYYYVRYNGKKQDGVVAKVRYVLGEDAKTLVIKVPIKKNVSERMQKKYKTKGPLNLSVEQLIEQLIQENPGLDIELENNEPYENVYIRRNEFIRYFNANPIVFTEDSFCGKDERIMQEIEIKSLGDPKDVARIKSKLKPRFGQRFITDSKINRVKGNER